MGLEDIADEIGVEAVAADAAVKEALTWRDRHTSTSSAIPTKCIGCRMCEYACSRPRHGSFDPSLSRIRVVRIEPITMTAITCRLCADAPCVLACPRDALSRSEENGTILVDTDKCDGCGWCVEACDFGAIVLNPSHKTPRSATCATTEDDGPRCVALSAPRRRSRWPRPRCLRQKARRDVVARLFEELLP